MYYNGLRACSYNAIFNIIRITRNTGKTWNFEYRAWKRGIKKGKRTIWLRTFKKEVKEVIKKLYRSSDLQRKCGIELYDKETKKGNFKQEGNRFYCRRKNKWWCFLEVFVVSDNNALRSADNVDTDTIVYDECDTTKDKQNRYRGNLVTDFIDIFISIKREHKVICFFLCNKESIRNPFFIYFNLPPLPSSFEGIRTYKKGSILVEQRNTQPKIKNEYDKKVDILLSGTSYGNYLKGAYKNAVNVRLKKTPLNAKLYEQLDIDNYPISIYSLDGNYYVKKGLDKTRHVCCIKPLNRYKYETLLINRFKKDFIALTLSIADNQVYYDTVNTYDAIQPFYLWLGL